MSKDIEKYTVTEKKHDFYKKPVVAEKPVVAPKKDIATFLAFINTSQIRDAEIAAMDVADEEQEYFEVVEKGPMQTKVKVSEASFNAIKRARPIIEIIKA